MVCKSQQGRGHSEGRRGKDARGRVCLVGPEEGLSGRACVQQRRRFPVESSPGALAGNWHVSCSFSASQATCSSGSCHKVFTLCQVEMKPPCPPPALPLTLVWHVSPSGSLSQRGGPGRGVPGDAGRPAGATSASWQSACARLSSSTETPALSAGSGVLPCSSHL